MSQEPEQLDGQMSLDDYGNEPGASPTDDTERDIETQPVGLVVADGGYLALAGNPNPSRITDAMWWFWTQLHALEPTSELGGIIADKRGYHNTRDRNRSRWPGDYSIREAVDQQGPADKAAALDWTFPSAQHGDYSIIARYTTRLINSGHDRDDPRLDGLREFYGQADADSHVEGWDCRHLADVSSDDSHLWHIHFSFTRALVDSFDVMDRVLSVLRAEALAAWRARTGAQPTPAPTPGPDPSPSDGHRPGTRTLRLTDPQMAGDDVTFVQRFIGPDRCGTADGVYGPSTAAGVRWYQQMRGGDVDGEVGPWTWGQMGVHAGG